MFASKCTPSGRMFIRRLIILLSSFTPSVDHFNLVPDVHLDVEWWIKFLPLWNGTSSFIRPLWLHSSTINLFTNASATLGCGGYFDGEWFSLRWPSWVLSSSFSIELLELIPIVFACSLLCSPFTKRQISFQCDNLGAVQAFNKLGSSSRAVLHLRYFVRSFPSRPPTILLFSLFIFLMKTMASLTLFFVTISLVSALLLFLLTRDPLSFPISLPHFILPTCVKNGARSHCQQALERPYFSFYETNL
ncbi:hypothetical protein RvY_16610-1 [Ramazzottius varieornatus]|uniref:RNase H type-1 domain-containing protein n=1 Tax=Ramazzottius varieornatus TaxID=947166 RepID=A0A1D1W0C0_RAMVA|nr:hypothetical protein RvY_16610-1 [Ramazzottius varieornatus]